jgi:lactate dehydrogenase-like 2-hydroxyacid dehydrogenase
MAREAILLLCPIPADLRAGLAERFDLVEDKPAEGPRPGFRIAVTTAMHGAGAAQFDRLPDLKLLSSQGTGLEKLDLHAAAKRGIAVAYTPDVMTEDVADAAIALMYGAARLVAEADRFVRAGRWGRSGCAPPPACTARPWASRAWARSARPSRGVAPGSA